MRQKGFTLTEVLLAAGVVIIIGSLVAFFLDYIRLKSEDSGRISDLKQLQKALDLYYDKHANYPDTLYQLVDEDLLTEVPRPAPSAGQREYTYVPLGANKICTGYHLGAAMSFLAVDYLKSDADAYPGVPCAGAKTADFDGTAPRCAPGIFGAGIQHDPCFDIKI